MPSSAFIYRHPKIFPNPVRRWKLHKSVVIIFLLQHLFLRPTLLCILTSADDRLAIQN